MACAGVRFHFACWGERGEDTGEARCRSEAAAASAAGAVQNLSREAASRQIIQQLGAVQPLSQLLSAQQLQVPCWCHRSAARPCIAAKSKLQG